jgi:hypothetical protein
VANPNIVNDRDLIDRAIRAYHRAGNTVQPSKYSSEVQTHDGRTYVVLRNMRGVLEVLRAVIQRINRKLHHEDERLRTTRSDRWRNDLGDFYIVNWRFNWIVAQHVEPEALAREIGVLRSNEQVSG